MNKFRLHIRVISDDGKTYSHIDENFLRNDFLSAITDAKERADGLRVMMYMNTAACAFYTTIELTMENEDCVVPYKWRHRALSIGERGKWHDYETTRDILLKLSKEIMTYETLHHKGAIHGEGDQGAGHDTSDVPGA